MNRKLLNKVMKRMESCRIEKSDCGKEGGAPFPAKEKDRGKNMQRQLEEYLWSRYDFRYNVLSGQTEYKRQEAPVYQAVSQRTLNSFCLEARSNDINCWDKDVSRLINSGKPADYHPFLTYMDTLPPWDGRDRITPLAQRISKQAGWVSGFHRWMLGMAAQWSGQTGRCANAVAPLLVSREQGRCKSSFCRILMPDTLKAYYTDSFELTGQAGCEQKLAYFGLINLDEFDRLPEQKLPLLKNLMQMKELAFRKAHRSSFCNLPRMASFIGTSNKKDLLKDPSGSRRYLCVEVKEKIDCTPPEHKQVFAQLKAELSQHMPYWFDAEEERELTLRNKEFYALPDGHDVFLRLFRLPGPGEKFKLYSASTLFIILQHRYPAAMRGMNANRLGKMLVALGAERMHTEMGNLYKVAQIREEA